MATKQIAHTVPELFHLSAKEWQSECRETARQMLRTKPVVTIEDVLAVCPRPKYIKPNATGGVFQHPDFKAVGFAHSKRQISHGRFVRQWTLTNPYRSPQQDTPLSWRSHRMRNREDVSL